MSKGVENLIGIIPELNLQTWRLRCLGCLWGGFTRPLNPIHKLLGLSRKPTSNTARSLG